MRKLFAILLCLFIAELAFGAHLHTEGEAAGAATVAPAATPAASATATTPVVNGSTTATAKTEKADGPHKPHAEKP
jgi:hypothetical protein